MQGERRCSEAMASDMEASVSCLVAWWQSYG